MDDGGAGGAGGTAGGSTGSGPNQGGLTTYASVAQRTGAYAPRKPKKPKAVKTTGSIKTRGW